MQPPGDNSPRTSMIQRSIAGYTGHMPGVHGQSTVGYAYENSKRRSRSNVSPRMQSTVPGVLGYAGSIRGRLAYETCGVSYDKEVNYLMKSCANPEAAYRNMANWTREGDVPIASRLFESRPLKVDLTDLLTTGEQLNATRIPVVRSPMRIPGRRSIPDDRFWSYQIPTNPRADVAGVPSSSCITQNLRYAIINPGFLAGGPH